MGDQVFEQVQQQLLLQGYLARCGQIVDASLVQAPIQRNKREEAGAMVPASVFSPFRLSTYPKFAVNLVPKRYSCRN